MIWISEPNNFPKFSLRKLREKFKVISAESLSECDKRHVTVIFCRLKRRWTADQLDQYPSLQFLVSPTTGHNHIDVEACDHRGVRVLSLAGQTEFLKTVRATIEYTIFLTLSTLRLGYKIYRSTENKVWSRNGLMGTEISGKKILIIGLGRVGSEVAHILETFGATIFYADPNSDHPRYQKLNLDSSNLRDIDITILSASYQGEEIIRREILIKLRKDSILVNTARAELINYNDLFEHLSKNKSFLYASDVFWNENNINLGEYSKLLELYPQCLLTPHIAGYTKESLPKVEEYMVNTLLDIY